MTENAASSLSIHHYHYDLPEDRIAAFPMATRTESKLLVYKQGHIETEKFTNLKQHLPANAVLVFNDTKVITARLHFKNAVGRDIEVFCLGPADTIHPQNALHTKATVHWVCMVGHLRRWKEPWLEINKGGWRLRVTPAGEQEGAKVLRFEWWPAERDFYEVIGHFGELPIPPYLNRKTTTQDEERYQTVYARHEGSVAAPTAGLHFTQEMLRDLQEDGVTQMRLTLHVGAGTFKPVKATQMKDHHMHSEWMHVRRDFLTQVIGMQGRPVICVGTTSLRALESIYWMGVKCLLNPNSSLERIEIQQWEVYDLAGHDFAADTAFRALLEWMALRNMEHIDCRTQILIAPPYRLRVAGGLITNFHQPQSTLLLLVAALLGDDWRKVYGYALEHDYRFLSYGDSSLLLK